MDDNLNKNETPDIGNTVPGTLYVVATPIGNLADLSPRAAGILASVDFIAAEDTRVTLKLLNHLALKKTVISCYRHNEHARTDKIISRIRDGENCALCCDAGTPAVSDPGEELVRRARDAGIVVSPIPGPSAAIAALSASGMNTGRFCFEGFLPMNRKTRRNRLLSIAEQPDAVVLYEAPHKLRSTLADLFEFLGDRELFIAREITKYHEEFKKTTLSAAVVYYEENLPRGEFVLIVSGKTEDRIQEYSVDDAVDIALSFIEEGRSKSEAAKGAAELTGLPRSEIYRGVLEKKNENNSFI